jgi:proton glutamate symport protein
MKKFRLSLTKQVMIGLALGGGGGGGIIHYYLDDNPAAKAQTIAWVRVLSRVFLSLIKVIIAPLLFSTLVVGIAGAGSLKEVGRIGLKAIIYFEIVTTLALFIGLGSVNITKPGIGVNLSAEQSPEAQELAARAGKITPQDHIVNIFPTSILKSMAENDVRQIVVFSLIFAIAVAACGDKGKPMLAFCESLSEAMFKFTNYVMLFAPWGVGAAMAVTVGSKGLAVLKNLALLIFTLYGALLFFLLFVLLPVALIIRLPIRRFVSLVKEPSLLAFTTTSSESAFPKAMENMERLACRAASSASCCRWVTASTRQLHGDGGHRSLGRRIQRRQQRDSGAGRDGRRHASSVIDEFGLSK